MQPASASSSLARRSSSRSPSRSRARRFAIAPPALSFLAVLSLASLTLPAGGCRFASTRPGDGGGTPPVDAAGTPAPAPDVPGLASIRIDPPTATVTVRNGASATQAFRAIGHFADGHDEDVTDRVHWSTSDSGIATVSSAAPATPGAAAAGVATTGVAMGGTVQVEARSGSLRAWTTLTVRLEIVGAGPPIAGTPALPADPGSKLTGPADPARAPELVYPNDGVLLPPNLGGIEVHFRPGSSANSLFEIAFQSTYTDLRVYTRCAPLGGGCLYTTTPDVWSALAATNRGRQAVALTVRATDDAGTAVGTSAAFKVTWAKDDLRGALYYWTTTNPIGILRWNFGDPAQTVAQKVVGPASGDGKCLGCHALSHDGKKMVMTSGAANVGNLLLFDVVKGAPAQPFPLSGKSWFESWSADGGAFVGVNGAAGFKDLLLFDGVTGAQTGTIPLGGAQATHPDWSLDGSKILYTDVGDIHDDQTPGRGGIAMVARTAPGSAWSAPVSLVPAEAGKNRYYPAIAPDNETVVFNQSVCPPGRTYDALCNADVDPSARLWAFHLRAGGATSAPLELARANGPGVADAGQSDLTNSYPKWSPFAFQLAEDDALFWVSFSSSRRYGLRAPPPGGDHGNPTGLLIWLAGVEPRRLAGGGDPSFAPFCLPFQDLTTSNHIAQWTSDAPAIIP